MTEHERNTRTLRRAADRIHKASDEVFELQADTGKSSDDCVGNGRVGLE